MKLISKRLIRLVIFGILAALIVPGACKKIEEEEPATDSTPPTLERLNLKDSCTNVSATSSLYLLFSEALKIESVTSNTESTNCTGSVQISTDDFASCVQMLENPQPDADSQGFTTFPSSQLDYSTTYKIKVLDSIQDAEGNTLQSPFLTSNGFTTRAASGVPTWTTQLGTAQDDYAKAIVEDSTGDFYVTGRSRSSFPGKSNLGSWDIVLLNVDKTTRTIQWSRQIGTSQLDYPEAMGIDGGSNIYIAGKTEGDLEGSNLGAGDIVLIKTDSTGDVQWQRQIGTSAEDWAFGLSIDSSNDIYITGKTGGPLEGQPHQGGNDIFLIKYDDQGVLQWARQFGSSSNDAAYDVTTDSSNNIFLTGHTEGKLANDAHRGERDIFVVKVNSSGDVQWMKQLGSDQDDYARGILIDASGDIIVTGYSYGDFAKTYDTTAAANIGGSDLVVFKLDIQGDLVWVSQQGSDKDDLGKSLTVDSSGDVFVTGLSEGSMDCNSNQGFSDVLLFKFNSSGTLQWMRQFGSIGLDYAKQIILTAGNELVLAGWTNGNVDANVSNGKTDTLLVKYDRDGNRQ
jgi:hypothetical protein